MPIPVNKEIKQVSYNGTNIPIQNPSTGNINITTTVQTDVKNYATAQIVDANLIAANIAKDVVVLGITGTHQGGITPTGNLPLNSSTSAQTGIDVTNYATVSISAYPTYDWSLVTP